MLRVWQGNELQMVFWRQEESHPRVFLDHSKEEVNNPVARVTTRAKHLQEEPAHIILDTDEEIEALLTIVGVMQDLHDPEDYTASVRSLLSEIAIGLQS